jgi:GT2 family glycosyltransferase
MKRLSDGEYSGAPGRTTDRSVSIVIPTFNRLDLTRECLRGIAETAPGAEVIVVDNGSIDGTRAFLQAEQSAGRLRCLLNEENLGFGRACNRAVTLSERECVLLLNSDIVPLAGWLDAMLAELDDPAVGIVGSRLLYPDRRIQHAGADFTAIGETEHVYRYAAADDPAVVVARDCPVVTGASLLVRRSLYDTLGGFDEGYWMYVEDVDLCIRAWHAGYRVRYCADSVLIHYESSSSPDHDWRIVHLVESWKRFHERWLGRMPEAVLVLTRSPEALVRRRRFVVAARAGELAADGRLFAAYGSVFDGRDEVTLTILDGLREGGVPAELAAAVNRAGLGADAAADLLALPCESAVGERVIACGVDAVYSRVGLGEAFAQLPAFDDRTAAELRAFAAHAAEATARAAVVATHA